jgi:diaminohydroxyphosphoribosylaminopyrimidine deaminase/5-amino-6-(5-phosphoribosylamino)uracil reductase
MDLTRTLDVPPDESAEARYQALLVELARASESHRFRVAPKPSVGAAVLAEGTEVARGFHADWGGPHAEVRALEAAAASDVPRERWDTLVLTLEPCSTHGKTPPCTDAILAAGIRRVVVGSLDLDPRHRGTGLEILLEAGLEVIDLLRATPVARVAPYFSRWTELERVRRPRPWVIAKWAQTRTGQMSPPEGVGDGRWISSPMSQAEVHLLRGRVDAIVTGIGTVLADDPRLTVRPPGRLSAAPLRVVLDTELRVPPDARLFGPIGPDEAGGEVHVLARAGASPARHRALEAAGARVHAVQHEGRHLALRAVLGWLWEAGARRVLLEAGPTLLSAAFESGLVDQVAVYTGDISGGRGPSMAGSLEGPRLDQVLHREVGDDALLEAFWIPPRS